MVYLFYYIKYLKQILYHDAIKKKKILNHYVQNIYIYSYFIYVSQKKNNKIVHVTMKKKFKYMHTNIKSV